MMESFFGPTVPPWSAAASTGFGWGVPTPRPVTPGAGIPSLSATPIAGGPGLSRIASLPGVWSALATDPYEIARLGTPLNSAPDGYTVPALLSAVAMRRGQPLGPTNDQEIEDFLYDALELLPSTSEVEVRCEGGRVVLSGSVQHKRLKRDIGELAWGIPIVNDVQNNVTIATKRRSRSAQREGESPQPQAGRKQA